MHNICADVDRWVYVTDRENHRVQVFEDFTIFPSFPSKAGIQKGKGCPIQSAGRLWTPALSGVTEV